MIIGLTGGLGCGKSEVARILKKRGLKVISADDIAHSLLEENFVKSRIRDIFGEIVFTPNGEVDRKKLAGIVFSDEERLRKLNSILHPLIRRVINAEIAKAREKGEDLVVEIPLLLESKGAYDVDVIVVVSAPLDKVIKRLKEKKGWSKEEIKRRLSKQMPLEQKERLADHVIKNDGTLEDLEEKVDALLEKLRYRLHR
ncbi:MAG: dephospho-CoA kinase [Synergistetes bacterium]|nr:dephospho-CoA kinase [Synergistota bacterium]